jgi:hypothetical protein
VELAKTAPPLAWAELAVSVDEMIEAELLAKTAPPLAWAELAVSVDEMIEAELPV